MLELLPRDHVTSIELVVLRQPTVKQNVIAPVWGRLGHWSEIGTHRGPGIFLEAQPTDLVLRWGRSLRPDHRAELERLKKAGFRVEAHSRGYDLHSTPEAIRASQLYRTIPHEVGHYVDYLESKASYDWGNDYERFWELYTAKPSREKEVYAHQYADKFLHETQVKGLIPFAPKYNVELIRRDDLLPEWFATPSSAV